MNFPDLMEMRSLAALILRTSSSFFQVSSRRTAALMATPREAQSRHLDKHDVSSKCCHGTVELAASRTGRKTAADRKPRTAWSCRIV